MNPFMRSSKQLDTPHEAGGLVSGAASRAVALMVLASR